MKAMILAAGLGTRLKPWTDSHPKALAPVNGKPLLQRNIEYLRDAGVSRIIVNTHHFANQIEAFVAQQDFGVEIVLSYETEPLETGGGLKQAAWFFEDEDFFLLMNADILTDLDIDDFVEHHLRQPCLATLAVTDRSSSRSLLFDRQWQLRGWRNNHTGEQRMAGTETRHSAADVRPYSFSGIHLINTRLLQLLSETGKFSLIDVYLRLAASGGICGYDHSGDRVIDVGKPESIAEAEKYFIS